MVWRDSLAPTIDGGWGGIRTHGTLAGTPVFKTGALNRSATHPGLGRVFGDRVAIVVDHARPRRGQEHLCAKAAAYRATQLSTKRSSRTACIISALFACSNKKGFRHLCTCCAVRFRCARPFSSSSTDGRSSKGHRAPDQALRPRAERVLHVHTLHGGHEVITAINSRQGREPLAERHPDLVYSTS